MSREIVGERVAKIIGNSSYKDRFLGIGVRKGEYRERKGREK